MTGPSDESQRSGWARWWVRSPVELDRWRVVMGGDGWWADSEERGSYPTDPTLPRSLA